jgi:hypothetical protein
MQKLLQVTLKESVLALALAVVLLVPGSDEPEQKDNALATAYTPYGSPGFMADG